MKRFFVSVIEVAEVAVVAVAAVFLIRSFLVQPFLVSGASMSPNFSNGDYLLVDELTYRFRLPERGEVMVFRSPNDESVFFIKRVVGLPGERVAVKDGAVSIVNADHPDGFALEERYLPRGLTTGGAVTVALGPDQYFVLGDNRQYSFDSRTWGALKRNEIVGLVRVRLWPPGAIQAFAAPQY